MKFREIIKTDLDVLRDFLIACKESGRSGQPEKITSVLNRVVISCSLYELNAFEVSGLLKISSSCRSIKEELSSSAAFIDEKSPIIEDLDLARKQADTVYEKALKNRNNNFRIEKDGRLLPVGYVTYSCVAVFRGWPILNIFGPDLIKMFEIPDGFDGLPDAWTDNYISTMLFNKLYSLYMYPLCTSHDIFTSAWTNSCIYSVLDVFDKPKIILNKIFHRKGYDVSFINTDQQTVHDGMERLRGACIESREELSELYVEFLCCTSIHTYFTMLFSLKNPSYIVDCEDFICLANDFKGERLLFVDDPDSGVRNVSARFISSLAAHKAIMENKQNEKDYTKEKQALVSGVSFDPAWLEQYLLIPMNSYIKYSMIIPCTDIIYDQVFRYGVFDYHFSKELKPKENIEDGFGVEYRCTAFAKELERLPQFFNLLRKLFRNVDGLF